MAPERRLGGGAVRLVGLEKQFDDSHAVRGIDLDIHAGEFFSLLGPSGCGKTTTLRMIAGFEQPTAGRDPARRQGPRRRAAAPAPGQHRLPVLRAVPVPRRAGDNVAFGLRYQQGRARGRPGAGSARCWSWSRCRTYAGRRPGQLSGGQQQRVALARALVLRADGAAARRAAGRAGRQAAQAPAGRAQGHPAVGRRDVRLRHPRPGGGAHHVRPAGGHARRPGRAGRRAGGGLLPPRRRRTSPASSARRTCSTSTVRRRPDGGPAQLPARHAAAAGGRPGGSRPGQGDGAPRAHHDRGLARPAAPADAPGTTSSTAWSTGWSTSVATTQVVVRLADGQTLLAAVPNTGEPASSPYAVGSPVRAELPAGGRPLARRRAGRAGRRRCTGADDRDVSGRDARALTRRRGSARPSRSPADVQLAGREAPSRSRTRGRGRRPGPRARPGSQPVEQGGEGDREASASTAPISPPAWPSRTTPAMVSRHRWSSSMRSFATSGCRNACAQRSNHRPQAPGISSSPCGHAGEPRRAARAGRARSRSVGELGRRRGVERSSEKRSASVSSWSFVLK